MAGLVNIYKYTIILEAGESKTILGRSGLIVVSRTGSNGYLICARDHKSGKFVPVAYDSNLYSLNGGYSTATIDMSNDSEGRYIITNNGTSITTVYITTYSC